MPQCNLWILVSGLIILAVIYCQANPRIPQLKSENFMVDNLGDAILVEEGVTGCETIEFDVSSMLKDDRDKVVMRLCDHVHNATLEKRRHKRGSKLKNFAKFVGYFSGALAGWFLEDYYEMMSDIEHKNYLIYKGLRGLFESHEIVGYFRKALDVMAKKEKVPWLLRTRNLQAYPFDCDGISYHVYVCNQTRLGNLLSVSSSGYFDVEHAEYVYPKMPELYYTTSNGIMTAARDCSPLDDNTDKYVCYQDAGGDCDPDSMDVCEEERVAIGEKFVHARTLFENKSAIVATNLNKMVVSSDVLEEKYFNQTKLKLLKIELLHNEMGTIGRNKLHLKSRRYNIEQLPQQIPPSSRSRRQLNGTRKHNFDTKYYVEVDVPSDEEIIEKHITPRFVLSIIGLVVFGLAVLTLCCKCAIRIAALLIHCCYQRNRRENSARSRRDVKKSKLERQLMCQREDRENRKDLEFQSQKSDETNHCRGCPLKNPPPSYSEAVELL